MQSKFAILALLLIGSVAVSAKIATTSISSSTFASAPQVVIDSSLDSDKEFAKSIADTVFFAPGADSKTLNAWMINWNFSQNTSISLVKRDIDATTLKAIGEDILINTEIVSKIAPIAKPGSKGIAFPTVRDDGKDTADQLYLNILSADAKESDTPIQAKITDNKDIGIGFMVVEAIWQKDTWYVLFTKFNQTAETELGIWIQGVKAADGSLVYESPIEIVKLSNPISGSMAIAGLNSDSDATEIIVAWKEIDPKSEYQEGSVMQTSVTIADGKVADAVLLRKDTESIFYYPSSVLASSGAAGPILTREAYTEDSEMPSYMIAAFINGATTPKILEFTAPESYFAPMVRAFDLATGFVGIAQYSGEQDGQLVLRTFDTTGEALTAQKKIGTTMSNMQFWQDAEGAIWTAYHDFDDQTGIISKSWVGKLIA